MAPARGLLWVILALAPWAYGCTRWWVLPWFSGALLVCVALWAVGLLRRRRGPGGSKVLMGLVVCLVLQGWILVANAGYRYDREHLQFFEVKPLLASWLPGGIDTADAYPMMLRITGLLGVMLIAMDAARRGDWRRHLFWTIVVTGTLLALYGLIQRISSVPLLFWDQADLSHNLFATFFYHGNAGAFMNMVLPFVFGAAIDGFAPNRRPAMRAFGVAALFLNLAAAVAISSKAAQLLTGGLLLALVVIYRRELRQLSGFGPARRSSWPIAVVLGLLCVAALASTADTARERWEVLPRVLNSNNPRLLSYQACLRMLPDAGTWGIGPGNFALAFPHYTHDLPDAIMGVWTYAHEDYLQTAIEWGWAGAAIWALLFFGALWGGWVQRNPRGSEISFSVEDSIIYRSGYLALLGVGLHALVDFPLQIGSIQAYSATMIGLLWCPRASVSQTSGKRSQQPAPPRVARPTPVPIRPT